MWPIWGFRSRHALGKGSRPAPRRRMAYPLSVEALEARDLPGFLAPINMLTGAHPEGIVAAPLTGNGTEDLVVVNNGFAFGDPQGEFSRVSILLGNGDGTFQPAHNLDAGLRPFGVAVGDFDGDGSPDLAVTHADFVSPGFNAVTILLGNGDGTFRAVRDLPVGTNPRSVAVGDFNGDGKLDLVTADFNSNTVSVLLGNGDGTFRSAVSLPVGPFPESVAVGDFGGDGKLSIVTADEADTQGNGGGISLLRGNGDGTFQAAVTLGLGDAGARPSARSIAVADVNGDGSPDLITANDNSSHHGTVSVLLGNGDGTFRDAVTYAAGTYPLSVAVGDFHGDGHPDLIVTNLAFVGDADHLFLLRGNGDGSFQAPVTLDAGRLSTAMVVGDFNSDGALDLAVANASGNDVTILLGRGDGSFNHAPDLAVGAGPDAVASADLTGNGILDLVTANNGDNSVSVLLGNGDSTFQLPVNYPAGNKPLQVIVGDFNSDGIPDLLALDSSVGPSYDGTLSLLLGNGDGTFQAAQTIVFHHGAIFPIDMVVGDFNGDGNLDVAISEVSVSGVDQVEVLLGNGDGTFPGRGGAGLGIGANPKGLAVGDFNGDGKLDLAVAGRNGTHDGVYVLLGHGDGGFGNPQFMPTGTTSFGVAVGDLNGDGVPDLVVTNFLIADTTSTVSVLLGHGDGTFQAAVNYRVGGGPTSVVVGDFNGDGIPDLATANDPGNTVGVLIGVGDGTFEPETRYLVGSGPRTVVAGDFNGDGAVDLATANSVSNNVTVLRNRNDGIGPARGVAARAVRPSASRRHLPQSKNALGEVVALTPPTASLKLPLTPIVPVVIPPGWEVPPADALLAAMAADAQGVHPARLQRVDLNAGESWRWEGGLVDEPEALEPRPVRQCGAGRAEPSGGRSASAWLKPMSGLNLSRSLDQVFVLDFSVGSVTLLLS